MLAYGNNLLSSSVDLFRSGSLAMIGEITHVLEGIIIETTAVFLENSHHKSEAVVLAWHESLNRVFGLEHSVENVINSDSVLKLSLKSKVSIFVTILGNLGVQIVQLSITRVDVTSRFLLSLLFL